MQLSKSKGIIAMGPILVGGVSVCVTRGSERTLLSLVRSLDEGTVAFSIAIILFTNNE